MAQKAHYFHAEANSLGGFIEKPLHKVIPSQASASLPNVGGHVQQRTEAFNFEEILSCRAAYTRVAGGHHPEDGRAHTTITSVVEGLNILEIVKADRVVAQMSVEHPDSGYPEVSFTGSHFEGLRIGGQDASPAMNSGLLGAGPNSGVAREPVSWPFFYKTGRAQAATLVKGIKKENGGDAFQWVIDRFGWMASADPKSAGPALCSLVDGLSPALPGKSFGHVIHVPNFGKIFFAEVLASSPTAVHLSMIRFELGCAVNGRVSICAARGLGTTVPP